MSIIERRTHCPEPTGVRTSPHSAITDHPPTDRPTASDRSQDDAGTVARVAAGDQVALAELYDRFAPRVYSLARHLCDDTTAAENITQEVFLAVWRGADQFDPTHSSPVVWLLTLAHHRAVDTARELTARRPHRPRLTQQDSPAQQNSTAQQEGTEPDRSPSPGPDADPIAVGPTVAGLTVAGSTVAGQVRDALAELAPEQLQALNLAYYGGHTQSEIARTLALPLGTVTSRIVAAMTRLRPLRSLLHELP